MRAASTLIPARFLTLIGHLCVVISLLWESRQSTQLCLASPYHHVYLETYRSKLVSGYSVSVAFILFELTTFILGLTMFSYSVSLLSIGCHGLASIILTYFILDSWFCDWYWVIFAIFSVVPFVTDTASAILTLCYKKW